MNRYYKFDNIKKIEPFICYWDGNRFHYLMEDSEFKLMMNRSNRNKLLSCLDKPTWRQVTGDEYLLYAVAIAKSVLRSGILEDIVDKKGDIK